MTPVKFQSKPTYKNVGTATVKIAGTLKIHPNHWGTGKGTLRITWAKCTSGNLTWKATRSAG